MVADGELSARLVVSWFAAVPCVSLCTLRVSVVKVDYEASTTEAPEIHRETPRKSITTRRFGCEPRRSQSHLKLFALLGLTHQFHRTPLVEPQAEQPHIQVIRLQHAYAEHDLFDMLFAIGVVRRAIVMSA